MPKKDFHEVPPKNARSMSAPNANNVGGPRQVTCKTSKKQLVAVDLDDLLCSHTFKEMYDKLGLEEHDEFPGVFPVKDISAHVFKKVMAWCKEHRGLPQPVIEKDAFTQEVKWLNLTPYEQQFLDVPVPALFELITAANFLNIPSLYHSACQAIAALIKDKRPVEVRVILRQRSDLSMDDLQEIFDRNPWLEKCHEQRVHIHKPIRIPAEVLVTIFEKLPRADIERFQLVTSRLRDVILDSQKPFRELSEERGPLRAVDVRLGGYHSVTSLDGSYFSCWRADDLADHLRFGTVRKLWLSFGDKISDNDLKALIPLKRAWKDATLDASLRRFSSDAQFRFAFTEVFFCKEVQLSGYPEASFVPQPFLRLPGMWQCNVLDIGYGIRGIQASDIREWLEGEAPKQLIFRERAIAGGLDRLVDSLKTAFLEADRAHSYKVRVKYVHLSTTSEQLWNDKTKEQLNIHMDGDGDLVVERK